MNVAGPSRSRPLPSSREIDNHEEDLTRMIAELGLSDVERLQALYDNRRHRRKGLSDREVAFTLLIQNARELAEFNADQALAQRLAIGEPDPVPRAATVSEQAVAPKSAIRNTTSKTQTWSELIDSFLSTPVSSGQNTPTPGRAPTITARATPRATGHNCVICQDPIFGEEVGAPCNHFFDIGCITDLFRSAMRDERLYPPRCCHQNVPLPQVRPHLTQALLAEFELKALEFGTLKRVYCVESTCSRFLGPLHEGDSAVKVFTCTSPKCTTMTCAKCRGRYYRRLTHSCIPDAENEGVLKLSRASGWSRCPGCAQMIELSMGCYHMTCRCKTEFCYLCRAPWKTCKCPKWDESRLLAPPQ